MLLMTSDGIDRLGFLIHDAQRLLRKRFEMRGADYGLSAAQWRLLVRVVKDEGVPQAQARRDPRNRADQRFAPARPHGGGRLDHAASRTPTTGACA